MNNILKTPVKIESIRLLKFLLQLLAVFFVYYITAKGSLELSALSGFAAPVWPPTGIALVILLFWGFRFWPSIFFGAFIINFLTGATFWVAFGIATGNSMEAIIGVLLLRRFGFNTAMETVKDALLFIFFGAIFNTFVSATIGVSSLLLGDMLPPQQFPETWLTWWAGDILGALVVGNLLLNTRKLLLNSIEVHPKILEGTLLATALTLFGAIMFFNVIELPETQSTMMSIVYLTSPLLIWSALRFGTIGSAFAIFVTSTIAIAGTAMGKGPFVGGTLSGNLLALQIFMGSVVVTTMVLASAIAERVRDITATKTRNQQLSGHSDIDSVKQNTWMQKPQGLPVFTELSMILIGSLCIIGALLSLNYFGTQTLSSIRAYVAGEGLWSKAQKDAVYQLHVYAISQNEDDFTKYKQLILIPLGDKKARLELEKPNADLDYADQGLIEGGNHIDDVRGMSLLFRRFRHVEYLERAIAIWEEGDMHFEKMMSLADSLQEHIRSGVASDVEIRKILHDIDKINTTLTALENNFSSTLGEAARWLTGLLISLMIAVATLLIVPGLAISYVVIRNISKLDRAKTEFISLTSHQLRTPPTGIKWYVGMLLDGDAGEINPIQRKYLDQISQNTQRMIDVVGSVLESSQVELGIFQNAPVETDVCALINKMVIELDFQIRDKQITLSQLLECGSQPIVIDPMLVRIVIQNLLVNAVKYTPHGGEISLAAHIKDSKLALTIADSGCGIPKQDIRHIFQKFFRASNALGHEYQGVGLGLYVAKRILDQIGGTIRFQSELGRGTTVFVTIPLSKKK